MYDKITPNTDDSTEEVVIKLESENLAKSLYYRDEGNVSGTERKHATGCHQFQFLTTSSFCFADEYRRQPIRERERREARHSF